MDFPCGSPVQALAMGRGSLCLDAALMDGLSMRLPVVKAPGSLYLDAALMDGFSMRLSIEGCVGERGPPGDAVHVRGAAACLEASAA